MLVPAVLLILSLAGLAAAVALPGWFDLVLVAGPMALASLYLLLRAWRSRPGRAAPGPARRRRGKAPPPRSNRARQVILDGSNVMHWGDGTPDLGTVQAVVDHARAQGLRPGLVFDANAGYLLFDRYVDDVEFAAALGLKSNQVLVVPKGAPADPTILAAARDLGARVISNDRFRDWVGEFPELSTPGHVIRGGIRGGAPWLDIDAPRKRAR